MPELYIGLMSGTSLDGVDGVLVDFSEAPLRVLAHVNAPLSTALTDELLALNSPGMNELHRAALAANALVRVYAHVVTQLLELTGIEKSAVAAIGAHGQTVRHQPQFFDGTGYTLQLNNPALLVELTGVNVVADFRSRDVAAGGQGAPLVPAFHQSAFGQPDQTLAVLNIGGMSNLSVLGPAPAPETPADAPERHQHPGFMGNDVVGFDCGPGNALMDAWCRQHTGQPFDFDGAWAAAGQVQGELLAALLDEPYFGQSAPKSTGRDLFNLGWLTWKLEKFTAIAPVDVQATLTELTASVCAACVKRYGPDSTTLIVCGGGAFNSHLMERLQALLPGLQISSSQAYGLPPSQVEAAAFAWLARNTFLGKTSSLESVTGATGARILGAVYPA
ncbi:MAG: anhydro-N-acetylmuramic acid kinase [Gammaproteobacteria bacterium]|uniref:anhydro-N-acetylmuramic acid kinase n=1 Tax=Rhodoferax sp. TaxID=50421 RepID=UPI0018155AC0|nr:anhydro-N-acetylmuramic acid kinase [Rhodoferax sp.]MBU3898432.1 anhydro-N-acetylmuramic acid kinase [Gammaproteobacteria bacterium]MBA3056780.1 anhydro-N-acetylmuramic acid kinase [Rhodoferax sp.]MBU3998151.1 anhydro-N-acetylmuramic acid kinase [Gammaproteobacteria bacterium]MBU4079206.1 anhydro-N-acetylmuramic acid kinase [Gammaproteobacteria bacterium]MBU4115351.1 anhydro-N-acetylmuramic acid kinase [Gammaproteobacteria bacterium]